MKKLSYILIANCLLFIANCYSQPVSKEWVKGYPSTAPYTQFQVSIGGTGTDVAHCIIQTTDGGYALAGYTWSFGGGSQAYIVKLNSSGMLQWTRTLGGTGWDDISSIIQTNDGGYIAAGSSIFKLDANGTLQWCENISGGSSCVIQTSDSGYAIAGNTNSFGAGDYDMFIMKLNDAGMLQWARTIGGASTDFGQSIIQSADGGFVVAGWSWSFGGRSEIFVVRLNSSGTLHWARTVGGAGDDKGYSIIRSTDGGYVVAGKTDIPTGHTPFYIVKLSEEGALQWTSTVSLRDGDIANSIIQISDGGYAVVGSTSYIEAPPDWYIVKLNSGGTLGWSRVVIGGTGAGNEAFSIIKTIDGGYAVAGVKNSFDPADDMYIVKYDSNWNTCGSNDSVVYGDSGTWGTITTVTPTVTSPTGFITPRTPTVGSGGTATIICVTGISPISTQVPVSFKLFQNYPNPFNPTTRIKFDIPPLSSIGEGPGVRLVVYDILGREITVLVNEQLTPGTYEIDWDATNYPSSIYFYRLESGTFAETRKMVLLK